MLSPPLFRWLLLLRQETGCTGVTGTDGESMAAETCLQLWGELVPQVKTGEGAVKIQLWSRQLQPAGPAEGQGSGGAAGS